MTLVKVPYNDKKTNDHGYYLNNQCQGKRRSYSPRLILPIDSGFFPDRHAQIIVAGQNLGVVGVLHPNVIEQFGLKLPCSILELNIEPFV